LLKMSAEVARPSRPIESSHRIAESDTSQRNLYNDQTHSDIAIVPVAEPLPQAVPLPIKHKYSLPEVALVDRYVDEPRTLKVAVIGAGLSGIIAGVLLPAKVPGIELTIFEKNEDVVGISCRARPGQWLITNPGRDLV
jgi:hypothetical protein